MIPKFRIYLPEYRKTLEVSNIFWTKEGIDYINTNVPTEDERDEFYPKEELIHLMQYTGLKDKNGVEIFEGDIVRYTWDLPDDVNATEKGKKIRVGKVFWSDWRASFAVGKKSVNNDLFRYVRNGNTVEVIGNIWEDGELLEVAE